MFFSKNGLFLKKNGHYQEGHSRNVRFFLEKHPFFPENVRFFQEKHSRKMSSAYSLKEMSGFFEKKCVLFEKFLGKYRKHVIFLQFFLK